MNPVTGHSPDRIAVDAADAATGYLGIESKQVPTATGAILVVPAVGAILAGLAGLRLRKTLVVSA